MLPLAVFCVIIALWGKKVKRIGGKGQPPCIARLAVVGGLSRSCFAFAHSRRGNPRIENSGSTSKGLSF